MLVLHLRGSEQWDGSCAEEVAVCLTAAAAGTAAAGGGGGMGQAGLCQTAPRQQRQGKGVVRGCPAGRSASECTVLCWKFSWQRF